METKGSSGFEDRSPPHFASERLRITNAAHSEVTFSFNGPNLRKTELSHRQIGNTELEYLAEILGGPGA